MGKNGDNIFYNQGKVGIGTENPSYPFEVATKLLEPTLLDASQTGGSQLAQGDLWQSFTAGLDGNITQLEALLNQGPVTGTFYLYEGEGTEGALLYSQAYESVVQGWQSFLLNMPVRLMAAETYTFRLDNAEWTISNNDKYSGGRSSTDPSKDFAFKTFMAEEMQNTTVVVTENRVGIANTTPEHTLDVSGNVKADTLFGDGSQLTGIQPGDLSSLLQVTLPDGATLYVYPTDNSAAIPWGETTLDIGVLPNITGGTSEANMDFNGEFNTQAIVGHQGNFNNGVYAAKLCAQWQAFGFDDWYLPAAGELNAIYEQLGPGGSGDMPSGFYWSSSENGVNFAWAQVFGNGHQYSDYKDYYFRCRCVRR